MREKRNEKQEKVKMKKSWMIGFIILFILNLGATGYFLYSLTLLGSIEVVLRYVIGIILVLLVVFFFFHLRKTARKKKKVRLAIDIIISILYCAILIFVGGNIIKAIGKVGNLTQRETTYSASIVTLSTNPAEGINDISSSKELGMLEDEDSIDGHQIPEEIIEENNLTNEVKYYDNYTDMLADLYAEEIEFIFLPSGYQSMFTSIEAYENIAEETKAIYTQQRSVKQEVSSGKSLTEPFTVLIMGIDSDTNDLTQSSSFNGDSLMLITFNPTTLNSTILSIPRDTYVPIACFNGQRKNKITHAAWQGEQCMMDTITGFTGIPIDYYVKINFKGAVQLVDALGGIDAEVPIGFCEQNSDRAWGENTICVDAGYQHLNGEQALAWARHRKSAGFDDFVRGQNQQLVVKAMLNKLKEVRSLDTVYDILDTVGNNMATNMTTDEILSLYNVGKDVLSRTDEDMAVEDVLSMQHLYLSGADASIYDYSTINGQGTRMRLYNFVPYEESLEAVIQAMKINLELEEPEMEKTFSFDASVPYEEEIIGKMSSGTVDLTLLPDFTGSSVSYARSYCNSHGISFSVEGNGSTVVSQSVPYGADILFVNRLTVYTESSTTTAPKEDDTTDQGDNGTTSTTPPGGGTGSKDENSGTGSGSDSGSDGGSSGSGGGSGSGSGGSGSEATGEGDENTGDGGNSGDGTGDENPLPPELNVS